MVQDEDRLDPAGILKPKEFREACPQAGLASIAGGWEGSEELAELWSHPRRISRLHGSGQLFAEPEESVLTDDLFEHDSEVFKSVPPKSD